MNGNERNLEGEGMPILREFIRLVTRRGDMIVDPFVGSGSLDGCVHRQEAAVSEGPPSFRNWRRLEQGHDAWPEIFCNQE
jgi:hypothetical protein